MASTIPYLCTALCPVFVANPHAGREGNIDALVEPYHALIRCQVKPLNYGAPFVQALLRWSECVQRKAWGRGNVFRDCFIAMFYAIDRFLSAIDRYFMQSIDS